MKSVFRTFWNRVRPLSYDSLAAKTGCEPETSIRHYDEPPIVTNCIAKHDRLSLVFSQLDTVSYCVGPEIPAESQRPYESLWTAWVSSAGVRIGKVGIFNATTSETAGDPSALFLTDTPTKLSIAFSDSALLCVAVERILDLIEVKRYTSPDGSMESIEFSGYSPILFDSRLVSHGESVDHGIICYYLKRELPYSLFARYEQDGFAIERLVISSMRIQPSRLIGAAKVGRQQRIYYIDRYGRDGTLKSADGVVQNSEQSSVSVELSSGAYIQAAEVGAETELNSNISLSVSSGLVYKVAESPAEDFASQSASVSVSLIGGEII